MSNLSEENIAVHNDDLPEPPRQSARNITLTEKGRAFKFENADKFRTNSYKEFQVKLQIMEQFDLDNCDPHSLGMEFESFKSTFRGLKSNQKIYDSLLNEDSRQSNYDTCFKPALDAYYTMKQKVLPVLAEFGILLNDNMSEASLPQPM